MQGWGHGQPPGGPPGGPGWGGPGAGGNIGYAPTAAVPSPAAGYGAPPPTTGSYEFNPTEDRIIGTCASRLMFAGCMQIVFGALQLMAGWAFGVGGWLVGLPGSIALIVIGALFIGAAGSFKRVTETRGYDIAHLMAALGKLSTAAFVQIAAYIVAIVLGFIIAMLAVFVFALALAR